MPSSALLFSPNAESVPMIEASTLGSISEVCSGNVDPVILHNALLLLGESVILFIISFCIIISMSASNTGSQNNGENHPINFPFTLPFISYRSHCLPPATGLPLDHSALTTALLASPEATTIASSSNNTSSLPSGTCSSHLFSPLFNSLYRSTLCIIITHCFTLTLTLPLGAPSVGNLTVSLAAVNVSPAPPKVIYYCSHLQFHIISSPHAFLSFTLTNTHFQTLPHAPSKPLALHPKFITATAKRALSKAKGKAPDSHPNAICAPDSPHRPPSPPGPSSGAIAVPLPPTQGDVSSHPPFVSPVDTPPDALQPASASVPHGTPSPAPSLYMTFDPSLSKFSLTNEDEDSDDSPPMSPSSLEPTDDPLIPGGSAVDAQFSMHEENKGRWSIVRDRIAKVLSHARLRRYIVKNNLPMPSEVIIVQGNPIHTFLSLFSPLKLLFFLFLFSIHSLLHSLTFLSGRLVMHYDNEKDYVTANNHNWRFGIEFKARDNDPTAYARHIYMVGPHTAEDHNRIAAIFSLLGAEPLSIKTTKNPEMVVVYFKTVDDWVTAATFNGSNGCIIVPASKLKEEVLTLLPILPLSRTNDVRVTRLYVSNIPNGSTEPRLLLCLRHFAKKGGFEEHKVLFAAPFRYPNSTKMARHGFFFVRDDDLARFLVRTPLTTQQGTMTVSYPSDEDEYGSNVASGSGSSSNNNNNNNNGNGNNKRGAKRRREDEYPNNPTTPPLLNSDINKEYRTSIKICSINAQGKFYSHLYTYIKAIVDNNIDILLVQDTGKKLTATRQADLQLSSMKTSRLISHLWIIIVPLITINCRLLLTIVLCVHKSLTPSTHTLLTPIVNPSHLKISKMFITSTHLYLAGI